MNPLTNVRNVTKLSQRELQGFHGKTSWHDEYKDSAWIFIGGLPYDLSEGDVLAVFSQWGEIVNINMIRDKGTGKFKGFGFICYENQKSTVLAVDNFNGIKILGRTIRVDHVKDYKPPKDKDTLDDITRQLYEQGCAPQVEDPSSKTVGGYALVESDEDDYRDDGFGTHSVLKGIPDRRPRSTSPADEPAHSASDQDGTVRKRRLDATESKEISASNQSKHRSEKSSKKEEKKKKKKTKKKHSKSKKDKKRRKRNDSESSSESSTDSDSSSSSSSESSSSDSESDEDDSKSRSKRRKHKRSR